MKNERLVKLMHDMCYAWGTDDEEQLRIVVQIHMEAGDKEFKGMTDIITPLVEFIREGSDEELTTLAKHQLKRIGEIADIDNFKSNALACYIIMPLLASKYDENETVKKYINSMIGLLEWFEDAYEMKTDHIEFPWKEVTPPDEN